MSLERLGEKEAVEQVYSSNEQLNSFIKNAIKQIESGQVPEGAVKMKKNSPTGILRADPTNPQRRYQPGGTLVTYVGMDADGNLVKETYGGGVAEVKENSVILQNREPRRYPADYKDAALAGKEIKGRYNADGTFNVDPSGDTFLYNEYVSDVDSVRGAYGVDTRAEELTWHTGIKRDPSFVLRNPVSQDADIIGKTGVKNTLFADSYIVFDARTKNGVTTVQSVHPITEKDLADTYVTFES